MTNEEFDLKQFAFIPEKITVQERTSNEEVHFQQTGEFVSATLSFKSFSENGNILVTLTGIKSRIGTTADMEIVLELSISRPELLQTLLSAAGYKDRGKTEEPKADWGVAFNER